MQDVLIGIGVVWLLVGIVWSRLYYARRHGVGIGVDVTAAFVGLTWPITIFALWRPPLCNHRSHVLARGEARERYESENRIIERTRLTERGE